MRAMLWEGWDSDMEYGIATKCIYGNRDRFEGDRTGAISFPIYQTATYAHPAVGQSTGFDYSRLQNPTRQQLEKVVASLEGGVDALAFSSGSRPVRLPTAAGDRGMKR